MTTRENILTILRNHKSQFSKFGVTSIGLFGSYIRNEQSSKSDIDFLVDFEPEQENFDNWGNFGGKYSGNFGYFAIC